MQFSLRTLLTIMLVVAAFFAGRMPVQWKLEMAIEEAKKQRERAIMAQVMAQKEAEEARRVAEMARKRAEEAMRHLDANRAAQEDGSISSRPTPKTEQEKEGKDAN